MTALSSQPASQHQKVERGRPREPQPMPTSTDSDEPLISSMVAAVRDFAVKLEKYERHADEERRKLIQRVETTVVAGRAGIDATVAAMRKDVWDTMVALQLDNTQHKDDHLTERKERATQQNDASNERLAEEIKRTHRQAQIDIWMGVLTGLCVLNFILTIALIFLVIHLTEVIR